MKCEDRKIGIGKTETLQIGAEMFGNGEPAAKISRNNDSSSVFLVCYRTEKITELSEI